MSIADRRVLAWPALSFLGIAGMAAALVGCNRLSLGLMKTPALVPIASVQQSERQLLGQQIRLQGRIAEVVPLIHSRVYRLEDDSGEIWVLDSQGGEVPAVGAFLSLEGRVEAEQILKGKGTMAEIYVRQQRQL